MSNKFVDFPRILLSTVASMLMGACAMPGHSLCLSGQAAMTSESLYFGTAKPGGKVGIDDWKAFVDQTITPRFPEGLSVWPASGQWRSAGGPIVREDAYVLNIVHPGNAASRAALDEIVRAYKARFQQESVLRVRSAVCASF